MLGFSSHTSPFLPERFFRAPQQLYTEVNTGI